MAAAHPNSFKARKTLKVGSRSYTYFSLKAVEKEVGDLSRLPFSLRVLMENLLRHEDGTTVKKADISAFAEWLQNGGRSAKEINFRPARVLMQDFTGVPAVVDLAAMRDAMGKLGGDAKKINPLVPVDLVIDHSVIVDNFGNQSAFGANVKLEYERNLERYQFLRWGSMAFDNFRVVPPGTGICHQVNLEYLAQVVWTKKEGKETIAYPDTLVGTDSHTTMVNGLAVLGWGVGGIEAEAAMLGQPQPMVIPDVVGFKLTGKLPEGATATDLVLTVTQMLRKKGVVNKFVEFYGEGLDEMPLANRATIANMAPGIRRDLRLLPGRRDHAGLSQDHEPRHGRQAGRGLCQEAGPVALQEVAGAGLHRHAVARHGRRRAEPGRTEAPAGPRAAGRSRPAVRREHGEGIRPQGRGQAHPLRGHRLRPRPRRRGDRGHHLLHQHLEPLRHAGRRPDRAQRGEARPQGQAVGEDLAGAGLAGRDRVFRGLGPAEGPEQDRLQPGRLRLHELHRQLRPAARPGHQGDRRRRPRRQLGALGQSQLRGPRQSADPRQLPRLADAGRGLRAGRLDEDRHHQGSDRHRQGRQARLPEGHLALEHGSRQDRRQVRDGQGLQEALRQRLRGRHASGAASRPSRA